MFQLNWLLGSWIWSDKVINQCSWGFWVTPCTFISAWPAFTVLYAGVPRVFQATEDQWDGLHHLPRGPSWVYSWLYSYAGLKVSLASCLASRVATGPSRGLSFFGSLKWLWYERKHFWGMEIWPTKSTGRSRFVNGRSKPARAAPGKICLRSDSDLPYHQHLFAVLRKHQSKFETSIGSLGPSRMSPPRVVTWHSFVARKEPSNKTLMQDWIILKITENDNCDVSCLLSQYPEKYVNMASGQIFTMWIFLYYFFFSSKSLWVRRRMGGSLWCVQFTCFLVFCYCYYLYRTLGWQF